MNNMNIDRQDTADGWKKITEKDFVTVLNPSMQ
jgi:hypothetical protein